MRSALLWRGCAAARAQGDPELLEFVAELEGKATTYSQALSAASRKMRYFEEYRALKGKLSGGRVRRREGQASATSPAAASPAAPTPAASSPATSSPATADPLGPVLATGVVVLPTTPELMEIANRAVFALASAAPELLPRLRAYPVLLPSTSAQERGGGPLSRDDETELLARAQLLAPNASTRILLTQRFLHDHWFSHTYAAHRIAIASLHDWAKLSPLAPEAFVAYQLLVHGLSASSPRYRQRELLHDDTRSCIYDLCADKPKITNKLRAAELCLSCERALGNLGIPVAGVRAAIAIIHQLG